MYPGTMSYNPIEYVCEREYGSFNCGGTYINIDDYLVRYHVNRPRKTIKQEILDLANNEIFFSEKDEKSAKKSIDKIRVNKRGNIYEYYD